MSAKRAKFRVGQVVRLAESDKLLTIKKRFRDSAKFDWYEFSEIFDVWSDDELRPLTRREKGD